MLRKPAALLLAAAIATNVLLIPTGRNLRSPGRAFAATHEGTHATSAAAIPTRGAIRTTGSAQADAAAGNTHTPSTGHDYTTHSLTMQEEKLLNLLNIDRIANGLAPLKADPELSRIARMKSEDMRDNNYFAHESPTWGNARQMLTTLGYRFSGAGENIAHHATVDKAQAAFMTSAGHRRNILSTAWTKVGIGVCYDRNGFIYATQIFVR